MRKALFPVSLLVFLSVLWVKAIYPASSGLPDPDFYWHIAYGQWMIEHGALPVVDSFSWTFAGQPYLLTQWLGELVMGFAYEAGGGRGTALLAVALLAVTIGFSWKGARLFVHPSVALGLAIMCNLVPVVAPMRPQLFSFALLAVFSYLAASYLKTGRRMYLAGFPILMAAWVNLHGGFVMGIVLVGLIATGVTAESLLKHRRLVWMDSKAAWMALAATVLATLINPYGYKALSNVVMIGGLLSSNVILEWQPVTMTSEAGWFYLLSLLPYVGLMLVSGARPRLTHGLIAGLFLAFGVIAVRHVAMTGAVMAPLIAALLAATPQYQRMLPTLRDPSMPVLNGLFLLAMLALYQPIASMGERNLQAGLPRQYPVAAGRFLVENQLGARVIADPAEGAFLMKMGIPSFIDGRLDLFGDRHFFQWYMARQAAPGWYRLIEQHQPTALLLHLDSGIRQAAIADGRWKQVYEDNAYSILVPASSALPAVDPKILEYLDDAGRLIRPYNP